MLLKNGYRHVYISRSFAKEHGFIPEDAAPGLYGYGGLVKCVFSCLRIFKTCLLIALHWSFQHWAVAHHDW